MKNGYLFAAVFSLILPSCVMSFNRQKICNDEFGCFLMWMPAVLQAPTCGPSEAEDSVEIIASPKIVSLANEMIAYHESGHHGTRPHSIPVYVQHPATYFSSYFTPNHRGCIYRDRILSWYVAPMDR